ncbi:hypothetical protein [Lactococcus lactis]|uniref:hypothetical protein n=1 Tax=Lactococcus lactis TaxID=1358 RepID=UPI00223B98F1|nr:hypothetical protein [Lactococcus lactis]
MSENNITNHANIKEITLKEMENVTKREIEAFVLHERLRLESKCGSNTHTSALNRTIAAIKSLYNYLCEQTEDSNGNTYMTRNVSRLIHIRKKSETLHYRAAQLEGKLFLGDETKAFLEFVEHEYEKSISNRARTSFKKNKVRDLAILSLFYHLDSVTLKSFSATNWGIPQLSQLSYIHILLVLKLKML